MTRTELINGLIQKNNYNTYLEIGVSTGTNFNGIKIPAKHSVDPDADATYHMTSDEFFENYISQKYDIIFVDGLHIHEQVYKDIINSLNYLNDNGTIVVHDCNPISEITQRREWVADSWHGDVWKSIVQLKTERTDIEICTVNTDEGCGIIRRGNQDILVINESENMYDYSFLENNRVKALNLISVEEFRTKFL